MAVEPADQEKEDFARAPVPADARMSWPRIVNVTFGIAGALASTDPVLVATSAFVAGLISFCVYVALAAMTGGRYHAAPAAHARI